MGYATTEARTAYMRAWTEKNREKRRRLNNEWKQRNRQRANDYKLALGCSHCGYNKCSAALEFHHTDAEQKEATISTLVNQGVSWDTVLSEVEKCIVVCANCHREIHASFV